MKKLMIAAAIVCAAVISQAAEFKWNVLTEGEPFYGSDGVAFTGNGYVFNTTEWGVESVFDAWVANQSVDFTTLENYAGTISFTAGETSSSFNFGTEAGDYDFTLVLVDGAGALYTDIGWLAGSNPMDAGTDITAGLGWSSDPDARAEYTFAAAEGFAGSGYYTVPEPTSGLLLLLGVAGMALRRRRA